MQPQVQRNSCVHAYKLQLHVPFYTGGFAADTREYSCVYFELMAARYCNISNVILKNNNLINIMLLEALRIISEVADYLNSTIRELVLWSLDINVNIILITVGAAGAVSEDAEAVCRRGSRVTWKGIIFIY